VEQEVIETVYTGYANDGRVCFKGEHPGPAAADCCFCWKDGIQSQAGLETLDLTVPAANNFDVRVCLSSEKKS